MKVVDKDTKQKPYEEDIVEPKYSITKIEANQVLKLIERGYSERKACVLVGVKRSTFRHSIARIGMGDQYARAVASLAEDTVNRMYKVLDDMREGTIDHNQARVELDSLKWFASKLYPKKYGDKVEHEQNINVNFTNAIPRPKIIESDAISSVPKQIKPNKA